MAEKAIGGSDVCHTCAAHCVVIEDLEARIRELEAALVQAIDGHKVWESIYGSSNTSRIHLAFLEAALKGSTAETDADASYRKTRDCEHEWAATETDNWERCPKCRAGRLKSDRGEKR